MNLFIRGQSGALVLSILLILVKSNAGQNSPDECLPKFQTGKDSFVLDTDTSVNTGATFLSAPTLNRYRDCVTSCCKEPRCNAAFMEKDDGEGSIKSCFLFDCLYKKKFACHFVKKQGYTSYILDSVYETYLTQDAVKPPQEPNSPDSPPVANAGPDLVVQPKDSVTLNGILSRDDKGIVSYNWQMLTDYPSAVIEKTSFSDQIIVSNLTSGKYKFQLTVTDAAGQSDTTTITVLVLTPEQSDHHCMVPKKVGPCRGSFPRWHYNAASGQCEKFTFGGCKENRNNYLTQDECTAACYGSEKTSHSGRILIASPVEECDAPCTAGQFTCDNGCCLDAGLECDNTSHCTDGSDENKCEQLGNKFRILMQIPLDEQKERCTEHPITGICRESQTKWYYDPHKRGCFRFNYGGCEGNNNRFDSEETCQKYCRGVTEDDIMAIKRSPQGGESDNQTGILAIAIVLGVAILILLGVLGYCFTRNRKSPRHARVPVVNPIATLGDKEHLVYNSTTKPI